MTLFNGEVIDVAPERVIACFDVGFPGEVCGKHSVIDEGVTVSSQRRVFVFTAVSNYTR